MGKKSQRKKGNQTEPKESKKDKSINIGRAYKSYSKLQKAKKPKLPTPVVASSSQNIIEKKVLIPLYKLNIKPKKNIEKMSIEDLKEFASIFDLNPKINYKLLDYLKSKEIEEYKKYIEKYKYSLDFEDASKLNCFTNKEIKIIKDEFNKRMKSNKLNPIEKIQSLSKLKLFNLLFFLLEIEISAKSNIQVIKKGILSYANPVTLIFKVPNKFGNIEIKYYSLITFFINLFVPELDKINNNIIVENNFNDFTSSSEEQIYFNYKNTKNKGNNIKINLNDFLKRKEKLEEFISNNNIKSVKNMASNISINLPKNKNDIISNILEKIETLNFYRERILEIINESDELILKKIKFIYYNLLFPNKDFINLAIFFEKCLKTKYSEEVIASKNIYIKDANEIKNLAIDNLNSKYLDTLKKPFNFNSIYYTFPKILEKNILQNNKKVFEAFKRHIKYIYSSNIMKDIYYLSPEFDEFAYPLENDEIIREMFECTIFVPFCGGILHGYTQKEIPEILIAISLEEQTPEEHHLSKIICELAQILNTVIHEQTKHYLKSLIFYNSFRYDIKKRINSDLHDFGEENYYINGILQKYGAIKKNNDLSIDGGEKTEIYLYGNILDKISFRQAYELFKLINWEKTIVQHIKDFQKINNKICNDNIICQPITKIAKNADLCDFIKIFITKFIESYNKNKKDKLLVYDLNTSSSKMAKNNDNIINEDTIQFDLNCFLEIKKNYIHDASW